jgi:hypothetical protein
MLFIVGCFGAFSKDLTYNQVMLSAATMLVGSAILIFAP